MSTSSTWSVLPSLPVSRTHESPIAFGRRGLRVAKTPRDTVSRNGFVEDPDCPLYPPCPARLDRHAGYVSPGCMDGADGRVTDRPGPRVLVCHFYRVLPGEGKTLRIPGSWGGSDGVLSPGICGIGPGPVMTVDPNVNYPRVDPLKEKYMADSNSRKSFQKKG